MPAPRCHACGAPLTVAPPVPRDAECAACGADVRCCANCRHYDPALNNACRETEAEPVVEKTRRNFCEYFEPAENAHHATGGDRAEQARRKLDALFGGGKTSRKAGGPAGSPLDSPPGAPPRSASGEARKRLDDLFRKPGKPDQGSDGG